MIRGIGTDLVHIDYFERAFRFSDAWLTRMFTKAEILQCRERNRTNQASYLATRWAAKEAVFKSVASLTKSHFFDLRIVETLDQPDGKPCVMITDELRPYLDEAGITEFHISLTTEAGFALAFVLAQGHGS